MHRVFQNTPYFKTCEYLIIHKCHQWNELYNSHPLTQTDIDALSVIENEITQLSSEYNADCRLDAINRRDNYYRRCEIIHRTENKYKAVFEYKYI